MSLVVITDSQLPSDGLEERLLAAAGHEVRRADCRDEDDVIEQADGADALLTQWVPVTGRVLDALPDVRIVSRLGIGYDMVDVQAATARGVAVANTPTYCIEEVAAHTLALLLALARGIVPLDAHLRAGGWDAVAAAPAACRPSAQTVAVVGLGRIGARVARALSAIGFRVLVVDPFVDAAAAAVAGGRLVSLDEALEAADHVTLHAPLTDATRGLIGREQLARLRPGATLVNTCRGGLVDEPALVEALRCGALAGAALDVFAEEPLPADSPLRTLPNVILTPHAAWYSPAALRDLPREATESIVDFLAGRPVASIVNARALEGAVHGGGERDGAGR
jgi:D-3-phosphoglycerate dehydrogenase